jgi:hypothetical protein
VWLKRRSLTGAHYLYDVIRGANNSLQSNSTSSEASSDNYLTSFNSDGWTLGSGNYTSPDTIVGWNWLASNTTVSNTAGSITSTVSANTTSGFSIVSYTSNALSSGTIGHGLGVAPSMIIVKLRGSTSSWAVYHKSLGATKYMFLNATDASATNVAYWNNTEPTSTLFSVGNSTSTNNNPATTEIAYCFAEVKGFSKFGSYTGNGSTDGPFVYTGFKPAFVMIKNSTFASQSWWISDNKRTTYNVASTTGNFLGANISDAEATSGNTVDFLSNGFKIRTLYDGTNNSGSTPIYMAFAENPFVSSKGLPCTAR